MVCPVLTVEEELAGFELLVNGEKGDVKVPLKTDVVLRTQGGNPDDDRLIVNISDFPDTVICQGNSDANGVFQCTVQFFENKTIEIKGYEDCLGQAICSRETNAVRVIAGEGKGPDYVAMAILGALGLGALLIFTRR